MNRKRKEFSNALVVRGKVRVGDSRWICGTRDRRSFDSSDAWFRRPVRAFHNVCRHRGALLCVDPDGKLQNGCVTCPYHALVYNSEGQLVSAPNLAVESAWNQKELGLGPVACAEWNGYIMVHLGSDGDFERDYAAVFFQV